MEGSSEQTETQKEASSTTRGRHAGIIQDMGSALHARMMYSQAMQRRLGSLGAERNDQHTRVEERQAAMASLQKELTDMKAKRERLSKQVSLTLCI